MSPTLKDAQMPQDAMHRWDRCIARHPRYGNEVLHICRDCRKIAYTAEEPDARQPFACQRPH